MKFVLSLINNPVKIILSEDFSVKPSFRGKCGKTGNFEDLEKVACKIIMPYYTKYICGCQSSECAKYGTVYPASLSGPAEGSCRAEGEETKEMEKSEMSDLDLIRQAAHHFVNEEQVLDIQPFGTGHINDTYAVTVEDNAGQKNLVLQRINHEIFRHPEEVMENILHVTSHLRRKIAEAGGDCERETLVVIPSDDGKPYYKDENGNYYRMNKKIERAVCYDEVREPRDFYESAVAFGHFQSMLADFPAEQLHETIPGFHDTRARFDRFCQVVEEDKMGRASEMEEEIRFVKERKHLTEILGKMQESGELPLRVTHNDTKLNNVMLDAESGKAVCVIDLDTVMPGLAVNDFGDSIRFGASTGAEDEVDLDKISCSMELFDIYTKGFVEGCDGRLTQEELKALPLGAIVMTLECGMRFLTDYLEGDVYFKVHREGHNRDRCRTQFKLVKDMEDKWEEMQRIVEKYM